MLPFLSALRDKVVEADYGHFAFRRAFDDLLSELPGGEGDYLAAIRAACLDLYTKLSSPGARYFIDKTPRYALVAAELMRAFPDAPFVFLWRDPRSIVASFSTTWGRGRWPQYKWHVDLFSSLDSLVQARTGSRARVIDVQYEHLVSGDPTSWERLFSFLELGFDPASLSRFASTSLHGVMGDKTGSARYAALSDASVSLWKDSVKNRYRKRWLRSYLEWIGATRLEVMGYDLRVLQEELAAVHTGTRSLGWDLAQAGYTRVLNATDHLSDAVRSPIEPHPANRPSA